ncbi:MAG: hypothetical protein Q8S57_02665 [Methanoregula sp.]|nr:hypothetical protein [Methanoregula sp.]
MPQHHISHRSDHQFLFPVDMSKWLPEDDLSKIILDLGSKFDLSHFYGKYCEEVLGSGNTGQEIFKKKRSGLKIMVRNK